MYFKKNISKQEKDYLHQSMPTQKIMQLLKNTPT